MSPTHAPLLCFRLPDLARFYPVAVGLGACVTLFVGSQVESKRGQKGDILAAGWPCLPFHISSTRVRRRSNLLAEEHGSIHRRPNRHRPSFFFKACQGSSPSASINTACARSGTTPSSSHSPCFHATHTAAGLEISPTQRSVVPACEVPGHPWHASPWWLLAARPQSRGVQTTAELSLASSLLVLLRPSVSARLHLPRDE